MPPRTREERLFGAACLKLALEERGAKASTMEIYEGALADLGLTDAEVDQYLGGHGDEVRAALAARRRGGPRS